MIHLHRQSFTSAVAAPASVSVASGTHLHVLSPASMMPQQELQTMHSFVDVSVCRAQCAMSEWDL